MTDKLTASAPKPSDFVYRATAKAGRFETHIVTIDLRRGDSWDAVTHLFCGTQAQAETLAASINAADAVVPRAMLEGALEHSKKLSALLSGGEHDLLESEQGWKRRAETAEHSLSEARAEIARLREALDQPYGFTMPEIIEIGKAVLPHLSSETTSQIGSIAHDVAAAVTRVMRARAVLAASNGGV